MAALLILPPGLAVAWLLARYRWRGKSIVETLVALPLVMPPVATGLILLHLFGRRGPIGSIFGLDIVFTWRAVVLAMMVMSFPLLVRASRVAFEEVEPRLRRALTVVRGHADGREAAAEALAWAWEHWDRLDGVASLLPTDFDVV